MVKVFIRTDTRYSVNRKVIRKAALETFARHKMANITGEVSVAVVGSRKMKELAGKYLGDSQQKHEILTFALEDLSAGMQMDGIQGSMGFINPPDGILQLGDVILCWPQVLEAASRHDILIDEEMAGLVSHGVEHLLGFHHE